MTAAAPKRDYSQVIDFQSPITYNFDGLATKHSVAFANDPRFVEAYKAGTQLTPGMAVKWRAHVACWAAQQGSLIEGDFIECGVNAGVLSRAICRYLDFSQTQRHRTFWLLDTWQGIPVEQMSDGELRMNFPGRNAAYKDIYEQVRDSFGAFPNVKLVRGRVPETLEQVTSTRIAYASIDMNIVAPEIAAGEWLWPRMSLGAFIVLDDYGWPGHHLQLAAWNEFAEKRGTTVLSLPTGQGVIVKQRA